jgi:hypothetical protein
MTGNQKSNGFVHLNPHAELHLGKIEDADAVRQPRAMSFKG